MNLGWRALPKWTAARAAGVGSWLAVVLGGVLADPDRALAQAPDAAAPGAPEPSGERAAEGQAPSGESAVTPPELVTFVEAEYPEEAKRQGLEGQVVLALQIDAEGNVTHVEVVEPAGHGFDEAAAAAARRFVFRPARRRGRAVAARILYRYTFHHKPAPAAEEPTAPRATLKGRVLIAEGEQPLAGARIVLTRDGRAVAETSSDAEGRFDFGELEPGEYALRVEATGFEPSSSMERLADADELAVTYRLTPVAPEDGTTLVVRGTRPTREVTRRTVSRREMTRVPGTSGDALRALSNLPGVARGPALSGILAVRGLGMNTTPVLIDGMWIPNVYHFGGLSSVVPTEMLDEINFYPGNFSVRYGRALGGVVDAHFRETVDDGRYHGLLQVDLIDVRALVEGPVPLLDGWNVIAAGRRSHVDAWLIPLVENEDTNIAAAPVYYDYQLALDKRPTKDSYLRIGMLGSDDRFRAITENSAAGGEIATSDSTVGVASIYTNNLSDRLRLELTAAVARTHQRFSLSTIAVDVTAYGTILRGEIAYRPWRGFTLRTGYDVTFAPYTVRGQLPEDTGPNSPDTGSFVTAQSLVFDHSSTFLQPAAYVEMDMAPSRRTQIVSGVRVDYTHDTERLDVSPRLMARYDLVHGFPRTTLKAGTGLFVQAPGLVEVVLSQDPTKLRSQRNFQNSIGIEQELSERVELSVEGFFNLLDDQITRTPNAQGVLEYNNLATGRVFGAELMLRYADDERFFGWLSYTLSRSERTWAPGEPSTLFNLDQTHVATLLASYALGKGWELGARFRYVTGNLYTPCYGGTFNAIATSYVCNDGPALSRRLPPFHQLDIRAEKRWIFEDFTLAAYLDLINAYNRENPDFIGYNYDYTKSRPQTASLPIVPSLGLRGEF